MIHSGRHFLQIPGPTNVPDRVLRAIAQPVIDHRGPEFARLTAETLENIREVFQTAGRVVVYPSSGTGACEAALVNVLSPGDRVVIFETGSLSTYQETGAGAPLLQKLKRGWQRTVSTARRRWWSSITRHLPASPAASMRFGAR
jgi:hypothetical protein